VRGEKRCMCFVCDFNGRELKDSSLLCCIIILLKVKGKIMGAIEVGCFLEILFFIYSTT